MISVLSAVAAIVSAMVNDPQFSKAIKEKIWKLIERRISL